MSQRTQKWRTPIKVQRVRTVVGTVIDKGTIIITLPLCESHAFAILPFVVIGLNTPHQFIAS
jgi:hypothetical protein